VKNKCLCGIHLDKPRQIGLVHRGINVLIFVVIKQAEKTVQANINARGLDHIEVQGV